MRIRNLNAASAATLAVFSLTMVASAELKSMGAAELDMHLPGGTAGLTIDGKSDELVAKESAGVIVVTAKLDCVMEQRGHLSCIKTGNGTREKLLWKYLEADKYHAATLSVERRKLKLPGDHEKVAGDEMGTLSLHGVQRQLRFHYAAERAGADIRVQGQISISLQEFNIKQPSFAGVHTGMLADISVRFTLRES